MLSCKELTEVITEYLEGGMSFSRRVSMQIHLGLCRHCRAYLRQMKATVTALGRLPDEPVPLGVKDELLARFRSMGPRTAAVHRQKRRSVVAAVEAVVGRARGWAVVGLIVFAAAVLGLVHGGQTGPVLGSWRRCLAMEMGVSGLILLGVGLAALRNRERISAGALAALGAGGALMGVLLLSMACPHSGVAAHALVVHAGGVLLGALLGAASSRLLAFRPSMSG
jgi:hypothetical protein